MTEWKIFDFVELSGRNPIRIWLNSLQKADMAKLDSRLRHMETVENWQTKWLEKYKAIDDIFEIKVRGKNVQLRPLGTYYGQRGFIILAGAKEKGDKIPKQDLKTATDRLTKLRGNPTHAKPHQFDADQDLEDVPEQGIPGRLC